MDKKIITHNEKETFTVAQRLAKTLKGGEVLCLSGDLGRGKTVFAKGLAKGLGVKKIITSPTFVLMKIYATSRKRSAISHKPSAIRQLCHVDAYRIGRPEELADIGLLEYCGRPDTVCVVEWADKIKKILPKKRTEVKFALGKEEGERKISVKKFPV